MINIVKKLIKNFLSLFNLKLTKLSDFVVLNRSISELDPLIEDDFKNASHVDGTYITYAGWNSEYTRYLPLLLQRYAIDDYCTKNDISYTDIDSPKVD